MQKQSILTIEGLKKNFGELSVLKQVDLKVDKGEVTCRCPDAAVPGLDVSVF